MTYKTRGDCQTQRKSYKTSHLWDRAPGNGAANWEAADSVQGEFYQDEIKNKQWNAFCLEEPPVYR
jgi:hypothetical protein